MENEESTSYLSTGELSKILNVSVRTIRYYDQIGLVQPSKKAAGGKRYYSKEDILKLQKIILLKSLNLSLEDSRSILAEQSMSAVLLAHQSLLSEKMEHLTNSLKHTQSLLNLLDLKETLHWEELIFLVANAEKERDWNHYFSIEQQSHLKSQLPKLESGDKTTKKWINMIKRIELCLEKGVSPISLEGQIILEDVDILSGETFGDNPELVEVFWEVRKSPEESRELGLYPISPAIIDFLEMAAKKDIPSN
ncbi:transcriptional regulator [Planococcus antarcticus DSM 14505]|uniref:Transcriptional regulator n=1 Tax=Planococcus antarcticus DSM 14505 TaxID=1185653 RepID=A0AA87IK90_9BACL|nr:MerR family transcriptional regulator [Planococcus antarcticus]EIM04973.1 transcriptional regulator [Planococcus antarcticus DSM 14505]